jgi:tetraacyldisaccharide 4'-kinase
MKINALEIGDEPMQFKLNFPVPVAVGEERLDAISQLYMTARHTIYYSDDAFQHRAIKAGMNIRLQIIIIFLHVVYLPTGDLVI